MNTLQIILHVVLIFFRLNDLINFYQKKKLLEKVGGKEKKRMTGEYYDFQLRWDLNLVWPWEIKSYVNVTMKAHTI